MNKRDHLGVLGLGFLGLRVFFGFSVLFAVLQQANGLRPIRESARSWGDEWLFGKKEKSGAGPFSAWNITGTYRGTWTFLDTVNSSSKFPDFRKESGNSVIELVTSPTKINGVHYVQGAVVFHDVFDNEHNVGGAQIMVEDVYIWPLLLTAVMEKHCNIVGFKICCISAPIHEMEKHYNIEIAAQKSQTASSENSMYGL